MHTKLHNKLTIVIIVATFVAMINGCEEGVFSPHESDCNQYYRCVHGVNSANRCGSGLHWNQNAKACDWPANAGCTTSSRTDSSKGTTKEGTKPTSGPVDTTRGGTFNGPTGNCSWYGREDEIPPGWPTACGKGFDRMAMSAAQPNVPNFPCGTKVLVKNLENDKTVVVTVDDKGPNQEMFPDRILDLTYGAFAQIGDHSKGIVRCTYEVLMS